MFKSFMNDAMLEANLAAEAEEVPVGAVIVQNGVIIAKGQNRTRRDLDPTAHAEIVAIRNAATSLGNFRLQDCDLWVTLEPCAMCAGAISEARIHRLYFGALDEKSGGTLHGAQVFEAAQCHHKPEIYDGIDAKLSEALLQSFFTKRRI